METIHSEFNIANPKQCCTLHIHAKDEPWFLHDILPYAKHDVMILAVSSKMEVWIAIKIVLNITKFYSI
jgi:hypothetical protein